MMTEASGPVASLVELLKPEQIETNLFRASHPEGRPGRLFGGQVIAQAVAAASRTVPEDRPIHSLHAYFLRPGTPEVPAIIEVERIRDGRSFTTRRVVVIQRGEAILNLDASFQIREEGLSHAVESGPLVAPRDDEIDESRANRAFLMAWKDWDRFRSGEPQEPVQSMWFRANGEVKADQSVHRALLAFHSDMGLLSTPRLPHVGSFDRRKMQSASLDHAVWFHGDVDVNEWHVYQMESPNSASARGYIRGTLFTTEGRLVASTMQEGLMRLWE